MPETILQTEGRLLELPKPDFTRVRNGSLISSRFGNRDITVDLDMSTADDLGLSVLIRSIDDGREHKLLNGLVGKRLTITVTVSD